MLQALGYSTWTAFEKFDAVSMQLPERARGERMLLSCTATAVLLYSRMYNEDHTCFAQSPAPKGATSPSEHLKACMNFVPFLARSSPGQTE